MTTNRGINSGGMRFSCRIRWEIVWAIRGLSVSSLFVRFNAFLAYRSGHLPAGMSVVRPLHSSRVYTLVLRATRVVVNGRARNSFACCRMVERTMGARRTGCRRATALKSGSRVAKVFIVEWRGFYESSCELFGGLESCFRKLQICEFRAWTLELPPNRQGHVI